MSKTVDELYAIFKDSIIREIKKAVRTGYDEFYIYPCGSISKVVCRILQDEFKISPVAYIDNFKEGHGIENIEYLDSVSWAKNMCVLLCSNEPSCYEQLRSALYEHVPHDHIYDLFFRFNTYDDKYID